MKRVAQMYDRSHFRDFLGHWEKLAVERDSGIKLVDIGTSILWPGPRSPRLVFAGRDVFGVIPFLSMLSLRHTPFCHDCP